MSTKSVSEILPPLDNSKSPLVRFLFQPIPNDLLVYFRFTFGAIILWEVTRYFKYGWIQSKFVQPTFFFKYYGFEWVQPLSEMGMVWGFRLLGVAAFCLMIGFCYRIATVIVFLGFTYIFLLDQTDYLNHFYLVSIISFLMCFLPAHRACSVDAWLRPSIKTTMMPAWVLWLIRLQVGMPYFFGAIAKMEADWLSGVPVQMMLDPAKRPEFIGALFAKPIVIFLFTFTGLLFDLLIVPALLWKRTRWFAVAAVLVFNVTNHFLFSIGIFPWFMILSTPLFFPPSVLKEGDDWIKEFQKNGAAQFSKWTFSWKPKLVISLLMLHFAIQIFLPFRHFLYPGAVNWTEEGHRFAWHMKLRVKRITHLRFFARSAAFETGGEIIHEFDPQKYLTEEQIKEMVKDPNKTSQFIQYLANDFAQTHEGVPAIITYSAQAQFFARSLSGEELYEVNLQDYLTDRQAGAMSKRPDMILQFAHFLAKEHAQTHNGEKVAITVSSVCSLNGRDPQNLIDPNVNLATIPRNLKHATWIMPQEVPYITLKPVEYPPPRLKFDQKSDSSLIPVPTSSFVPQSPTAN